MIFYITAKLSLGQHRRSIYGSNSIVLYFYICVLVFTIFHVAVTGGVSWWWGQVTVEQFQILDPACVLACLVVPHWTWLWQARLGAPIAQRGIKFPYHVVHFWTSYCTTHTKGVFFFFFTEWQGVGQSPILILRHFEEMTFIQLLDICMNGMIWQRKTQCVRNRIEKNRLSLPSVWQQRHVIPSTQALFINFKNIARAQQSSFIQYWEKAITHLNTFIRG